MIDLRSDTVTKPTAAMRNYMMQAAVGDDVFGEDPSINALEAKICKLFGTEAALFTPTATMSNQIAIKILTQPLDEIICDRTAHIYSYEVGGYAFHSGCSIRYINGERGILTANDILNNINPEDVHKPITSLVCLENTANRGGGKIFPLHTMQSIHEVCKSNNLKLHLDGSRVMNALVASGDNAAEYGKLFDTITICFSKGLGCPMGSVLTGKKVYMDKARRVRKVFGGGMRQAGIMAAACIYGLDNHVDRLAEDHAHAKQIENTLLQLNYVNAILSVETNIVIFRLGETVNDTNFIQYLAKNDIHAFAIGDNWVRFVTHLDVNAEQIEQVNAALKNYQ
ncbi:MAG: GntG family PLP-dependent aldolase [Chitinophagales bacterium]